MSRDYQEQFDFEDEPKKKSNKNLNKKNNNVAANDQFYDLDDQNKNVKLPSINNKNTSKQVQSAKKKNNNLNLEEISKNKVEVSKNKNKEYEEEFQEPVAESPKISKKVIEAKVSNKSQPVVEKQQENNEYGEEQFEELEEQKKQVKNQKNKKQSPSPIPYKHKDQSTKNVQNPSKPSKTIENDKPTNKTQATKQKTDTNHEPSRNSVRSQSQSRSIQLKSRTQQKKDETLIANKYSQLAQKSCPDYDKKYLEDLNMDKLVRENDKVRGLIKKLNDELNDLINKNILQLKNKKQDKVTLVQDTLKVLEEQKSNNQAAYQIAYKQLNRLKNKQGQLKQQQFQLLLQSNIAETKASIAQYSKILTKIRNQINNQGIKLLKIDKQSTVIQDVNAVKTNLLNAKKEQEKNDQNIKKLDIKQVQLNDKITAMQNKIKSLTDDASMKGYSIASNPYNKRKVEQLRRRIEIGKQYKMKTQALLKTKADMVVHQSDQIRNQIKLNDKIIQMAINNCEQTQVQSKKAVDKAKRGGRLSNQFVNTLQSIISQMQYSAKTPQSQGSSMAPKGPKKYQSVKNVEKIPLHTKPIQEKEEISLKKPSLFKKKQKDEEQEPSKERVWRDQKDKQVQKKKSEQFTKFEDREPEKKDEEKKKPFVIKKNRQSKTEIQSPIPIQPKKQQNNQLSVQPKKEDSQTINIAPRMMKFKKNKPEDQSNKAPQIIEKKTPPPVVQQKNQPQKTVQQQDKINFVPKRFNLRPKQKKNEQAGYTASIVQKKQEQKIIQKAVVAQEYKPKGLNIQKQPIFKIQSKKQVIPPPIVNNAISTTEEQEKPKFNLRLRDRQQRQSNKLLQPKLDIPLQNISKQPETKIAVNLTDNNKPSQNNLSKQNNPYINPYANSNNPIKKQREGPIKKQRLVQNVQKQNFNIYQQAQDITNVNEIKIHKDEPKYVNKPIISNDEPDLNTLLGIGKKNAKNDLNDDLLVDNKVLGKKEKKNEAKKDTNFFGDLEL